MSGNTALSGLVVGTEQRLNEIVSVHAENTYSIFTRKQTLINSYGVTLTPDSHWTISGAVETGQVFDPDASDFDRQAISLGTRYADKTVQAHLRGEVRFEDTLDNSRDRQSYLLAAGVNWQADPDWRLQANLDGVISHSGQAVILDGDYVEANIGYAYRPIDNERLEALFRYTYLHDLPGPRQVNAAGASMGPAQRSHVLSVDANYDINEFITIGAKYGFRFGAVSTTRLEQDFQSSSAHLGIIRADIDILDDWAVLLEGRALYLPEAGNTDWGALAALYRDVGSNVKVGLGYNFGRFTDDLLDLSYDDQGVFLNVIASY